MLCSTWRWITDSEGQKLNGSIDYEDAYYAGTSLKFDGNMDAGKANHIKLYSAKLDIKEDSKLSVTYKTPDNKGVKMSVDCASATPDDANFKFYDVETSVNGESGPPPPWIRARMPARPPSRFREVCFRCGCFRLLPMNIGRFAITTAAADAVTPLRK